MMIASGIAPLDDRLGGLVPRRTYVITGAPGTGKTIACLEFLAAGFDDGEKAVLLTSDDPTDLVAQGQYLGIDLERQLATEQLVLLRYQLDFTRRFARSPIPELAFDELRALIGSVPPKRIVVDSVAPLLEASTASGAGVQALVTFLESLGATALVTYPADLAGLYDRRLEPLVQRAGAILHFSNERDHGYRMELRKVRFAVGSTAPIAFSIQPGMGLVSASGLPGHRADSTGADAPRVLVVDTASTFPADLLAALKSTYAVTVRTTVTSAFAELAQGHSAVLIEVRRDSVADALTLVRELRRAGSAAPIAFVTQFMLRSDDRARALRAGADEFLAGDLHPSEFVARLDAAMERGHANAVVGDIEVPFVTQRTADGGRYELLDGHGFRNAVNAHMAADRAPFFTVLALSPQSGTSLQLGDVVLRGLRVEGGDLAGLVDAGVAVYLHSARRKDVKPFVARIREEWRRAGHGELDISIASYPSEEAQVLQLLGSDPAPTIALVPTETGTALEVVRDADILADATGESSADAGGPDTPDTDDHPKLRLEQ